MCERLRSSVLRCSNPSLHISKGHSRFSEAMQHRWGEPQCIHTQRPGAGNPREDDSGHSQPLERSSGAAHDQGTHSLNTSVKSSNRLRIAHGDHDRVGEIISDVPSHGPTRVDLSGRRSYHEFSMALQCLCPRIVATWPRRQIMIRPPHSALSSTVPPVCGSRPQARGADCDSPE